MIVGLALGSGALTLLSLLLYIFVGGVFGAAGLGGMIVFPLLTLVFVKAERSFLGKDDEEERMQSGSL